MIEVTSYSDVNGVRFGASEAEVVAAFGQPNQRGRTHDDEEELRFQGFFLRFDSRLKELRECSLIPGCAAKINGIQVVWSEDFLHWLKLEDSDLKEVLGFVLSLKLGLAVSGFHDDDVAQRAIHAFRRGDWDMFLDRMRPYPSGSAD